MRSRSWLIILGVLGASCVVEVEADRRAREGPPVAERNEAAPHLEFVERLAGGAAATDRGPTVIAIHGLGDTPESSARLFDSLASPARLVYPRAPLAHHGGFAWTKHRIRGGDERALEDDL